MFITILIGAIATAGLVVFGPVASFCKKAEANASGRYGYEGLPAWGARVIGGAVGFVAVLLLLFNTIVTVQTPNVGIELAFGKPVGHVPSGLSLKAPWQSVITLDGSVQTWSFTGANGCITVRIADAQTACADISVQGQINPNGVDALYRKFNGNGTSIQDNVSTNLVFRRLEVDMNQAFANYNPVTSLQSQYAVGTPQNPSATDLTARVQRVLQSDIGGYVTVRDVLMPRIVFDAQVQTALNGVLKQKAATEIALQAEQTASANAAANRALQASLNNDPGVLVSKCLDIVQSAVQANYTLPGGFSCFGGSSAGILVNGTTGK